MRQECCSFPPAGAQRTLLPEPKTRSSYLDKQGKGISTLNGIEDDEVAIVYTPPGQEHLLSKAMSTADVVVVPTRVGGIETARVETVFDLIPSKTAAGLVVCSARQHTPSTTKILFVAGGKPRVPVWGTVPERVAIAAGPEARLLA